MAAQCEFIGEKKKKKKIEIVVEFSVTEECCVGWELLALALDPKQKTSQLWNSLAEAKVRAVHSTEHTGETQATVLHKASAYIPRGQEEAFAITLLSFHHGKLPEVAAAEVQWLKASQGSPLKFVLF